MVSCFLIQITDDMNSIGRGINSALQLSRIGGGVGITLSNLREAGAPIKGYEGAASGVMPVMKLFEDSFSYSNQLGQRQGAGVVYLNVFHPDIISFLSAKKENADEKIRVKTLSLGVLVPDKFYELTAQNKDMYLFSPYSVELEYGVPFSYVDITKEYDNLVANPKIRKDQNQGSIWKMRFPNCNKNPAIRISSTSTRLIKTIPSMARHHHEQSLLGNLASPTTFCN